jgi:OPA family glycerol-3-phosphate transporter-like MFS transporter
VTATAIRPRRRLAKWQVINLGLMVIGYSGYYLCRSNLSVAMPLIIEDLMRRGMDVNAARVALGSIASIGVLAYAIGKFPSGSLADIFGGRRNFLFGMGGAIAFTLLFAASGTLPLFTLTWMGNRLVQSLGWSGAVKIASRWFPFRQYGTMMAIISLSYLFGDAVARQFMGLLISAGLGWRGVFASTAAVLSVILLACWWLRETPRELGEVEPEARPDNLFVKPDCKPSPRGVRNLLAPLFRSRAFWLACALSLGTTILRETFNLWTPTYLTEAAAMAPGVAAGTSALFPFFGGVSVILCGWLSDRIGRAGRACIILGGVFLSAVILAMVAAGFAEAGPALPVILVALIGFLTIGPYSFLGGAIALDFGGKQGSGTASGTIDGIGYLGGVLAGGGMARISAAYGWSGAFFVLSLIALLTSVAAVLFLRDQSGHQP